MPNYTKLFNSIVTSTIWTEDDKTRIVWITMLALSDQNGEVQSSIPGLARMAGVSVKDTENAISKFMESDEYSRTPDNEGRRIAKIDGGWELLNHAKYRRMASLADKKEAASKRQKRFRDRNATVTHSNATVTHSNATVTHSNATVTPKTYIAEAEAEAEAEERIYPPTPKGGYREKSDKLPTSPQAIRISELFSRRLTTKWSDKEIRAFKAIPRESMEELDIVCRYTEAERLKGDQGRHRRDLATFLNNFNGELDRARAKSINGSGKTTSASNYGI